MKTLLLDQIDSELGSILLVVAEGQICALDFEDYRDRMVKLLQAHFGPVEFKTAIDPEGLSSSLRCYLAGDFEAIAPLPVNPGGTAFQQMVWAALRTIPVGTYWTYGELAARLGKPGAARAVGLANSKNPVSIVVPCHRVIGAKGKLTGYAGGIQRKRWLLHHEGVVLEGPGQGPLGRSPWVSSASISSASISSSSISPSSISPSSISPSVTTNNMLQTSLF